MNFIEAKQTGQEELKNMLEALLFSSGRKMSSEELSKLCKDDEKKVISCLKIVQKDYETRASPLMLVDEGNNWKLTVREKYLPLVRKIVTETELSKSVMETLAVVAFKMPARQSDIIKIRTNKAYDHMSELESAGYITREKFGRTKLIRLTQKFYDYFDIPEDKLKERFKRFEDMEKAIAEKEKEAEKAKAEVKKTEEEIKKQEERKSEKESEIKGKLGDLEVYDGKINGEETGMEENEKLDLIIEHEGNEGAKKENTDKEESEKESEIVIESNEEENNGEENSNEEESYGKDKSNEEDEPKVSVKQTRKSNK